MTQLFVAWRDSQTKQWYPVGLLMREKNKFRFSYTRGVEKIQDFVPFVNMKDLKTPYESDELFFFFQNRILSKNRPEFPQLLKWLNLENDVDNCMGMLALTEGKRATDALTLFPCPTKNSNGECELVFFVNGISHMSNNEETINRLQCGDSLYLLKDVQNDHDDWALLLRTGDPVSMVGYCPRYFSKDFSELIDHSTSPKSIKVIVEKVNTDAPSQFRLLCKLTAPWPHDFNPCSGEEYEPLAKFTH